MSEVNYKSKYEQLKQKFQSAVDMAFRLGYEQGMQAQEQQAAQQAQEEQAAMEQAQAQGMGQPGEEGGAPAPGQPGEEAPPASAHPEGSELDQHISQLEQALGKAEYGTDGYEAINKSLIDLKGYAKGIKLAADIAKGNAAVKSIAKSLKAPKAVSLTPARKPSAQAEHNLSSNAKAAVAMQEQIVSDVMKAWEAEQANGGNAILNILAQEGASKKE